MWQRIQATFLLPSQYFPYITRGFKIACLNITSLSKQIDKLPVLLADKWFDIISIKRLGDPESDNCCEVF